MEIFIALFNLLQLEYVPLPDIRLEKYLLNPPPRKKNACMYNP